MTNSKLVWIGILAALFLVPFVWADAASINASSARYFNQSEVSSSTAADQTNHNGGSLGRPTLSIAQGKDHRGLAFDGVGASYFTANNSASSVLNWGTNLHSHCVNFWVNTTTNSADADDAMFAAFVSGSAYQAIGVQSGNITVEGYGECGAGGQGTYNVTGLLNGQYHMITGSYNLTSTTMTLFYDGAVLGTRSWAPSSCITPTVHFGAIAPAFAAGAFVGSLDEMLIKNETCTAAVVTELYNGGTGLFYPFTSTPSSPAQNVTVFSSNSSFSSFETQEEDYWLNLTYNNTAANLSCTVDLAGLNSTPCVVHVSIMNGTSNNITAFRTRIKSPIVSVNSTGMLARINVSLIYGSGYRENLTLLNRTMNISHAFVLENVSFSTPIEETVIDNYRANVSRRFDLLQTNISLFYAGTRHAFSSLQSLFVNLSSINYTITNRSAFVDLIDVNNTARAFQWEITRRYANGSVLVTNTTVWNQSVLWAYLPGSVQRTLTAIEGSIVVINATMTKTESLAGISGVIDYLNVNRTAVLTVNSSTSSILQLNYTNGLINLSDVISNITAYFYVTFNGVQMNRSTATVTQQVYQMILTNCSASSVSTQRALNFTLKDELSLSVLNGTLAMNFVVWSGSMGYNRSYGFSYSNADFRSVCIFPNTTLTTQGRIQYEAVGYPTRNLYFSPFSISNVTQLYDLLLLRSNESSQITLNVIDELSKGVTGAVIRVLKYDVANNGENLTDTVITGVGGSGATYVVLNKQYRFEVFYNNILEMNQSFMVTQTTYTFKIIIGSIVNLDNFIALNGFSRNISCSNNSRTGSFIWTDGANAVDNVCLKVVNTTNGGWTVLSSDCSSNNTGVFNAGLYPINNTLVLAGIAYQGSRPWIVGTCEIDGRTTAPLSDLEGVFWSAMLLIIVVGVGFYKVPIALFMMIPWLLFVTTTHLLTIGYTALLGITAVLGLLIIWALKR